jgi:hypothetical protein
MAGRKGKSGRKPKDVIRLRPVITLVVGQHDQLIEFFRQVPRRHQGEAIIAAMHSGLESAKATTHTLLAREEALAAQERAEIDVGLAGLGGQWDEPE